MYKVIRNLWGRDIVPVNNLPALGEITLFIGTKEECNNYIK
jgi:hypothetical protein